MSTTAGSIASTTVVALYSDDYYCYHCVRIPIAIFVITIIIGLTVTITDGAVDMLARLMPRNRPITIAQFP